MATRPDLSALRLPNDVRPRASTGAGFGTMFVVLLLGAGGAAGGLTAHSKGLIPWTLPKVDVKPCTVQKIAAGAPRQPAGPKVLLQSDGYIAPRRKASVGAPRPGKLVAIHVDAGDSVVENQIIARLDDAVLRAEVARAEATLREAKRELKRREELVLSGATSRQECDAMATKLEVGEAELKLAIENLKQTEVRAPFSGIVVQKLAELGEAVGGVSGTGGTGSGGSIVLLADTSSLEVEADVQEARIRDVQPGQDCEIAVDAFANLKIKGKVRMIMPSSDRKKSTVQVKVTLLAPPEGVRTDMGAKVSFLSKVIEAPVEATQEDAVVVLVPKAALRVTPLGPLVWVVRDGKVQRVPVTTGDTRDDAVEVVSGLVGSEALVVSEAAQLQDGMGVRTE